MSKKKVNKTPGAFGNKNSAPMILSIDMYKLYTGKNITNVRY